MKDKFMSATESKWPKRLRKAEYAHVFQETEDGLKQVSTRCANTNKKSSTILYTLEKDAKYIFKCMICASVRVKYKYVVRCVTAHVKAIDTKEPIICPVCNEKVENKFQINEHFDKNHSEMNKACCCECLAMFDNEDDLLHKHILQVHHPASSKNHLCTLCGNSFNGARALREHIVSIHEKAKHFMCSDCGQFFPTKDAVTRHGLTMHAPRKAKCLHCEKTFPSNIKDKLMRHLEIHTGKICR